MEPAIGSVRSPLLIGRDDLLDLADRRLDDVAAGHGHLLLVAGEAGIGKSRFLEAVDRKAVQRGFRTTWGFVAPQDLDVPAASILDMARSMLRDPDFAALGADLLALRDATTEAALSARRALVADVVDRLLVAIDGPLLYGFEDLQWADDLSLEIIGDLARRARDRRVMICAGYRTDEATTSRTLRDWRARLLNQRIAEEVHLRALTEAETGLVTTLILDTGLPAAREVTSAVYERTDGIPLHIEELLGALGPGARADGFAIRDALVPDTIEDAVLARLARRSPEAQAVARAGAVIGRCFVPEVLAGIMDQPVEALDAPLQELIDHVVLYPPGERGLIDFQHQLLRDAIYRSVPLGDRRRFHARAAEFCAALEGQSTIHASAHYERAGLKRRAFETALASAQATAAISSHRESFELYRRAVENLPDDVPAIERAEVLSGYAVEAWNIEENAVADQAATEAVAAFRAAGETARALSMASEVVGGQARLGRPVSELMARNRELRAEIDALPDSPEKLEAVANVALSIAIDLTVIRDLEAARVEFATVRRVAELTGDDEWRQVADWKESVADFYGGDVDGAIERMGAVAQAAEALGRGSTGVSAYRDAAVRATYAMDYPTARRWLDRGLAYSDAIEQSMCAHVMTSTSAMVAWAAGDWAEAETLGRQAMADRGCRIGAELARTAIASVELGRGRFDTAIATAGIGVQFGVDAEQIDMTLMALWVRAEAELLSGDGTRAAATCHEAMDRARAVGERIQMVPFVVTGVRAEHAAGRPAAAGTWLVDCEAWLERFPTVADAAISHGRGLVALADGATGVARAALEAAVRGWDAKGRIWEASWARLDLAHCLARSNRFADALELAVDVRETASGLGSPALAGRADAIARMARGHVADEEPWRPLTAREFAVARLIADGRTNAEIADVLGIAAKTASSHVEHILAKLGAARRAEIATWAANVDRSTPVH